MRFSLPLITILPLFAGCDNDGNRSFASRPQSWAGSNVVIGQHDWVVTCSALYFPGRAMVVEGILTGGPPGQDTVFEVLLEAPATSTAIALPLVSWDDPQLGTLAAGLVRDPRLAWPKALAKNRVSIVVHSKEFAR